ncbi:nuclear receptor NHR-88 [Aphelenchoides avenae]|nr:nuclear receptor NHR-88 [Aphelenchus avenae]
MDDVATVEQFGKSMSKCGNLAVAFANSLFTHANVDDTTEKMAVVKNSFAALCVLQKAWCTAARPEQDALYLLNRTRVPRNVPQHILNAK